MIEQAKRMYKAYEELEFRDDFMFGKVMQDLELCHDVLECLLQRPVGELQEVVSQREFRYTSDGKPIRLDIYTEDSSTVYDAEMQNLKKLYDYIETGRSGNELTERIDEAVARARKIEKWRSAYMKEMVLFMDARDEGREEGREEVREEERKKTEAERSRADKAEEELGRTKADLDKAEERIKALEEQLAAATS